MTDFAVLRKTAKTLFAAMHSLPPAGRDQWKGLFHQTFSAFDEVWRVQATHRHELGHVPRWELGDIASKIAQLYYLAFLRTSDRGHLAQSLSFYSSVVERGYFIVAEQGVDGSTRLKVAELNFRFHLRYVTVLMLGNAPQRTTMAVVTGLGEADALLTSLSPDDEAAWGYRRTLLDEIASFVAAVQGSIVVSSGHEPTWLPLDRPAPVLGLESAGMLAPPLRLGAALVVGNTLDQAKFGTITHDMFRMFQMFRWGVVTPAKSSSQPETEHEHFPATSVAVDSLQPHVSLLHQPTTLELLMQVSTLAHELCSQAVLLLYISCDGASAGGAPGSIGLVNARGGQALFPTDLGPVQQRVPFVLIVDGFAHENFVTPFTVSAGVVLQYPGPDSLLTSFLHAPVTSLMQMCGNTLELPHSTWLRAKAAFQRVAGAIFSRICADPQFSVFLWLFGDEHLRQILVHFLFFAGVIRWRPGGPSNLNWIETCCLPKITLEAIEMLVPFADILVLIESLGVDQGRFLNT